MIEVFVIVFFIIGYIAIACENLIHVNKTATALLLGVGCWTIFSASDNPHLNELLASRVSAIAEIAFFLVGAMTIVEFIDAHEGFGVITKRISTKSPVMLLWIIAVTTFFLSAVLDNLTSAIVMVSVVRKLITEKNVRWLFAGMIIIAANAGGAWSPIGDVTTTMLWIGGQITSFQIIKMVFVPALISALVPLALLSITLKRSVSNSVITNKNMGAKGNVLILLTGFVSFIFVPIFKTITNLPPYIGMFLGVGVVWIVSELTTTSDHKTERAPWSPAAVLSRIDTSSVLFFVGILLAVGALDAMNILASASHYLQQSIPDNRITVTCIGLLSAIVDNVPLIAASIGMFDLSIYPIDDSVWHYLAFCTGTGGSLLLIGSAAGVAVMGIEKISFGWYLKKITLLAAAGFFAGALVYVITS